MEIIDLKKGEKLKAIRQAVAVLKKGGLIIYPTETCYGLGADATNLQAISKLLAYKGQRGGKPIAVAVYDRKMAENYVEINETAKHLYQTFLPGPMTVVSKSKGKAVKNLEMHYPHQNTLGIRIPNYSFVLELIRAFGKPITATSANTSGKKTPYSLADIRKYTTVQKLGLIDLFLDAGKLPPRPPSTVVDTTMNEPTVLRQGEITIPEVGGQSWVSSSEEQTKQIAQEIFARFRENLAVKPLLFALQGELGAGKTQFAKGLGRALGISENIVSPTFVIIREYWYRDGANRGKFYHLDTWRLEQGSQMLDLGLEKMLTPGNVIAVEWLQKIKPVLEQIAENKKATVVWVSLEYLAPTKRKINYQV